MGTDDDEFLFSFTHKEFGTWKANENIFEHFFDADGLIVESGELA